MGIDSTIKQSIKRVCSRQCVRPSLVAIAIGMFPWIALFGVLSFSSLMIAQNFGSLGESFSQQVIWPVIHVGRILLLLEFVRRYFDPIYVFAAKGMSARHGRLSLKLQAVTVRYADIREMRVEQNILGRFLCYGTVLIATASSNKYEIQMKIVSNPHGIIRWISEEKLGKKKNQIIKRGDDKIEITSEA